MIATTWPDTFATIEPTRDPVKIAFSERISERPTRGTLDNAVIVSPVTGEHEVKHTRSGLEISVIGGFQENTVFRVRLLPTIKDMFGNTLEGPFELVFTTGAPFETNVVAGIVKDRITGEPLEDARVEARARGEEDPPVHVAASDTAGVFALRYLPAGSYDVSLYQDVNRNAEPDYSELQGMAEAPSMGLDPPASDTTILREVNLLRGDSLPSRLVQVEAMDSLLVRFGFDDFMDSEGSLDSLLVQIAPQLPPTDSAVAVQVEDTTGAEGPPVVLGEPLRIERLMWPRQVDSLRAVMDSIAVEEQRVALADSLGPIADSLEIILAQMETVGDTVGADTIGPRIDQIRTRIAPPEPREEAAEDEPSEAPPALPQQEFFVLLADSLAPDQPYQASVSNVVNINLLGGGGGEVTFTWEPPEPPPEEAVDTAGAQADTAVVPDTAGVRPDTTVVPDTSDVRPDTSDVRPDTTIVQPDTTVAPPKTSVGSAGSRPAFLSSRRSPFSLRRRKQGLP